MGFTNDERQGDVYFVSLKAKIKRDEQGNAQFGFKVTKPVKGSNPEFIGYYGRLNDLILKSIEWRSGVYDERTIHTVKFTAIDNKKGDLFLIDMSLNGVTRAALNKLPSSNTFGNISFATFASKADDGKEYLNIAVREGDELLPHKYDMKETYGPLIDERDDPENPGKKIRYYHKVNDAFYKLVENVISPAITQYYDSVKSSLNFESKAKEDTEEEKPLGDLPPSEIGSQKEDEAGDPDDLPF